MNPGAIVWQCHGCGEIRDDEWISVAHLKVPFFGAPPAVQLNARYCNDRVACLFAVGHVLEKWAEPLRAAR
jgi:hypothetical protein